MWMMRCCLEDLGLESDANMSEIKEGRSRGRRHNYIDPLVNVSGEDVTLLEFSHDVVITNEPLIVLLENTISDAIAELIDDSIEARFGCSCLPTTIKDFKEVITQDGNFVTVKTYNRGVVFFVVVNRSVTRLPVLAVSESGVHLLFDFTHDERIE